MTQAFKCPSCGAPLKPKGNAAMMNCPYCHASVMVPEGARQGAEINAWPTLLFDNFASNENNWRTGNMAGDQYFHKFNQAIANGHYQWHAHVNEASSMSTAWLQGYPLTDFQLSVNCKHIKGSKAGSSWGIVFRVQDNQNLYAFRMTDGQYFAVARVKEMQWHDILAWTRTNTIKPSAVNQMEVLAVGNHFTFSINGQVVAEAEDDHFQQGLVGLVIEGYTPSEEIVFDFLDVTLRAP